MAERGSQENNTEPRDPRETLEYPNPVFVAHTPRADPSFLALPQDHQDPNLEKEEEIG